MEVQVQAIKSFNPIRFTRFDGYGRQADFKCAAALVFYDQDILIYSVMQRIFIAVWNFQSESTILLYKIVG